MMSTKVQFAIEIQRISNEIDDVGKKVRNNKNFVQYASAQAQAQAQAQTKSVSRFR